VPQGNFPNVNGTLLKETLVGTFVISRRFVNAVCARLKSADSEPSDLNCELDSHADTVCAGRGFVQFEQPDRFVDVHPYSEEYDPIKNIPITTAATVWTSEKGDSFLLLFPEALFFGDRLKQSLICPNQLRANGLIVHDVPRQFDRNSTHSIRIPDAKNLIIPLELNGIMSCFPTRTPSADELENLPRVMMTSAAAWKPHSNSFADAEESFREIAMVSIRTGDPNAMAASAAPRMIAAAMKYRTAFCNTELEINRSEDDLYDRLVSAVQVASDDVDGNGLSGHVDKDVYPYSDEIRKISALKTTESRSTITPELLAKRWCIGLPKASQTLKVTTQAGVRNVLVPSERKVRKKAPWLKFPNVKGRWYLDQMFSKVPSIHGDKGATVYTNGQGYDVIYPWKSKGHHPDTLMSLIHDVGIPQTLISDGAKELIHGRAKEVCNEERSRRGLDGS